MMMSYDVMLHHDDIIISRPLLNNHMVLVGCAIDTELFSSVFPSKMKSFHCIEFECFFCKTSMERKIL